MEKLYIKHFGPVREADVCMGKVTVMIGEQGSGKSTVAKLYALFSWLEKTLMRHIVSVKYISQYNRFAKTYAAYNSMEDYFNAETELHFYGNHYDFDYKNETLSVVEKEPGNEVFKISKVMYVPAERNVLGSVDHPSRLKGLSQAMMTFLEEYDQAKINIKSGYSLPFRRKVKFEYDQLNDIPKLRDADYEIKLSAASSGYQSALPLLLVSKNLSGMVRDSLLNSDLSEKERKTLQKEVENVVNDPSMSDAVRTAVLRSLSSRYRYSRLVNIVEEMELNLFPDSQQGVLYELLADTSASPDNRLMLTTHSPYVINYLTLSVKAAQLAERLMLSGQAEDLRRQLETIVPTESRLKADDLKIYELENGQVHELSCYDGLPSDDNFLNGRLNHTNELFDDLLDIESRI